MLVKGGRGGVLFLMLVRWPLPLPGTALAVRTDRRCVWCARRDMLTGTTGAGTALDALRLSLPLILVPNPALLDNHQLELAKELDKMGYAVHGRLEDLSAALKESDNRALKEWNDTTGAGGRGDVMDVVGAELGYEPEARKEEEVRGVLD